MKTIPQLRLVILCMALFTIMISCEKNVSYDDQPGTSPGNKSTTNLSGLVIDEAGIPLSGVNIKVEGYSTVTDAYGIYILENIRVNKNRFVVSGSRPGFFDAIKGITFIKGSGSHNANLAMLNKTLSGTFQSQSGGIINLSNGSGLSFPASAFVDMNGVPYNGNVKVFATHINMDTPGFLKKIPGGDLRAVNAAGEARVLESFGMLKTELVGSAGQLLNLAPSAKATLTFAIANSQLSTSISSIPLWYFDEETALWKEEGNATKNGNVYTGEVSHFTWWNCDFPSELCNIEGYVKDCIGNPVGNVTITFANIYQLTTDNTGHYQATWPAIITLNAQVLAIDNPGLVGNSNIIQDGPFTAGSTNLLPDLVVPCNTSRIQGTLRDCNAIPVSGYVVVTGNQLPTAQYCANGIIDIHVLPFVPVNIIGYYDNTSGATSAAAGNPGQIINIGNLTVCDVAQITTVVLNGDGYNNQTFEIDTTNTNSIYSPTGPTTGLIISGFTVPMNKQCLMQIDFCGNTKGNYPLGPTPTCNSDVSMILNGVTYYPDDANSSNDFISVVEYPSIGGNIVGTFFTHLARIDSLGNIPITMSGTFIVPRRQ